MPCPQRLAQMLITDVHHAIINSWAKLELDEILKRNSVKWQVHKLPQKVRMADFLFETKGADFFVQMDMNHKGIIHINLVNKYCRRIHTP